MALSTEQSWDTFLNTLSRDPQKVARVMYLYLVETGYGQKEATLEVYRHFDFNYASIIMQCYNFSRRNGGKFAGTKLGGVVTEEDVLAFVKAYPKGIEYSSNPGSGAEMEAFLRKRIEQRAAKLRKQAVQPPIKQAVAEDEDDYEEAYEDEYDDYEEDERPRRQRRNVDASEAGYTVLGVGIGVLLIVLMFAFNWFGIRSLLVGLLLDVVPILWIVGSVILLIALVMDKVGIMEGRGFLAKGLFFVAIVVVTEVIGSHLMSFLMKYA